MTRLADMPLHAERGSPEERALMAGLEARKRGRADAAKAEAAAWHARVVNLYLAAQQAAAEDTPAARCSHAQVASDDELKAIETRPPLTSSGVGSAQMRIDEVAAAATRRQGPARPFRTSPPRFDSEAGHSDLDASVQLPVLSPRRAEPENALLRAGPSGTPDGTSASPSATRAAAPQACAAPRRTARGPRARDNGVTAGRDPLLLRLAWTLAWAVVRAELEHRRRAPPAWRPP